MRLGSATHEPGVLPYVFQFHELRRRREKGPLSREERQLQGLAEDLLAPQRVWGHGFKREPLRLRLHREARVVVLGRLVPVEVSSLSLWGAEVVGPASELPPRGSHVIMDVQSATGHLWFPFVVRVLAVDRARDRMSVSFEHSLGL